MTRQVGSGVYWVDFREDGRQIGLASYAFRCLARRAARRFIDGKLNPIREEIK